MAAFTLGAPLAHVLSKQSLVILRESANVHSEISKPCLSLSQTSLKRRQSVRAACKSVVQAHNSASPVQVTCSAGLKARCSTEQQTTTIQHQSAVITNAPVQGKEKTPELDDGGTGGGPGGDGGGGGGGGGGGWYGGFFFFGILAFLSFIKDKEDDDDPYKDYKAERNMYR